LVKVFTLTPTLSRRREREFFPFSPGEIRDRDEGDCDWSCHKTDDLALVV
jgi:hypothetical protein